MRVARLAALVVALSLVSAASELQAAGGSVTPSSPLGPETARCPDARHGLAWYVRHEARWHAQSGSNGRRAIVRAGMTCKAVRQAASLARVRARAARRAYERWFRETYARWACIHSLEGAWTDAGAPYYGGLQMDWTFQRAYGPRFLARWGHAGRWPVWAQLIAAERARAERGYRPWPNTGARCGLL